MLCDGHNSVRYMLLLKNDPNLNDFVDFVHVGLNDRRFSLQLHQLIILDPFEVSQKFCK